MKTLKCLVLSLCIGCQLIAQTGMGIDRVVYNMPSIVRFQADSVLNATHIDSIVSRTPYCLQYETDTVIRARNCAYAKQFECADFLLSSYNADHQDITALSLHGQVLYWMQDFERSIRVYEKAFRLSPPPSTFHLDYARVLYGSKKLVKAESMLKTYRLHDSSNVEADIMGTYIDLWNGKLEPAGKKANRILQQYPGNANATDIVSQIYRVTVPYLKIGREFFSDDQPLKGNVFYAEGGVYKSWLVAPTAHAAVNQFKAGDTPYHSSWLQLSNTIQLGMNNSIKLKAGLFTQNSNDKSFTGSAEVSRKITGNILVHVSLERRPYQYTVNSLKEPVMENVSGIDVSYNRNEKWLGKVGYESSRFNDGNKINAAYLWVMTPVVSGPRYSVSGGYAFRFSDAINNTFMPKRSIEDLVNSMTFENIAGIYHPYFTPENQQIHSLLATGNINLTKQLQFTSRMSIGVIAKSENPYLWLDEPHGDFEVFKGYSKENFTPVTLINELRMAFSERCSLTANHTYEKLLYYKSHRGGIGFKYIFLK